MYNITVTYHSTAFFLKCKELTRQKKRKKNEKKMLTFGRTSGILIPVPSDRDRLLKETQGFRKEIKKKFKKVLDKQNTA